ncbi:MAG: ribosomal-processing cysteine protease Prp [Ruminococcaceae bacterium]|nr:ribosomal-processing cysteine protease Prp [Oscillospiraceae bacterium]
MIIAEYDKSRIELKLSGHANYARKGEDIVCAAVSALAFTYAEHNGGYTENNGAMVIKAVSRDPVEERILDVIIGGLRMISREYPDNLLIKENIQRHAGETAERKEHEI